MLRASSMDASIMSTAGEQAEIETRWKDWRVAHLARSMHDEVWALNEDVCRQSLLFDEVIHHSST